MKKYFSIALFALAALSMTATARAATAVAEPVFQQGATISWLNVKATSVACKHNIAGLDNIMDQSLAQGAAAATGVALTKANFQDLLQAPKAVVMDALEPTAAYLSRQPAADCTQSVAWAESFVKSAQGALRISSLD